MLRYFIFQIPTHILLMETINNFGLKYSITYLFFTHLSTIYIFAVLFSFLRIQQTYQKRVRKNMHSSFPLRTRKMHTNHNHKSRFMTELQQNQLKCSNNDSVILSTNLQP